MVHDSFYIPAILTFQFFLGFSCTCYIAFLHFQLYIYIIFIISYKLLLLIIITVIIVIINNFIISIINVFTATHAHASSTFIIFVIYSLIFVLLLLFSL